MLMMPRARYIASRIHSRMLEGNAEGATLVYLPATCIQHHSERVPCPRYYCPSLSQFYARCSATTRLPNGDTSFFVRKVLERDREENLLR